MAITTRGCCENLEKLATYLERLPADYGQFGMQHWVIDRTGLPLTCDSRIAEYALENGGLPECGTAACAIGHGPAAGVLVPADLVDRKSGYVDWRAYSRLFCAPGFDKVFTWCFSPYWAEVDDTPNGAAARIRYIMKHGQPPEGFRSAARRWVDAYAASDSVRLPEGEDSRSEVEAEGCQSGDSGAGVSPNPLIPNPNQDTPNATA